MKFYPKESKPGVFSLQVFGYGSKVTNKANSPYYDLWSSNFDALKVPKSL